MNNTLLIPLLIEASFFLIAGGFSYIVVAWRQKKKHLAEMDKLLKTIKESEVSRKQFFQTHLNNNFGMNDTDALPLADSLMQSEKTFMHDFVSNFFSRKHKTLTEFFNLTCAMTDSQFELLPKVSLQPVTQEPAAIEDRPDKEESIEKPELTFDISIDEAEEESKVEADAQSKVTESIENQFDEQEDLTELSDKEINQQTNETLSDNQPPSQEQTEKLAEVETSLDDDELEKVEDLAIEDSKVNTNDRQEPSWDDAFEEVEEPQEQVAAAKTDNTSDKQEKETILEQI